jgi:RHS repeat-associated protein
LDAVELTHMNGRVQDPELGRFLSADPFVQAPYHSQSLNRYSYLWNNPLTFVDPSGFQTTCVEQTDTCTGEERQRWVCWWYCFQDDIYAYTAPFDQSMDFSFAHAVAAELFGLVFGPSPAMAQGADSATQPHQANPWSQVPYPYPPPSTDYNWVGRHGGVSLEDGDIWQLSGLRHPQTLDPIIMLCEPANAR